MSGLRRKHGGFGRVIAAMALALLAGCSTHVDVVAGGAAPAAATHLWVTVQEVWLATAADALPESGTGWVQRSLATPVALDLANLTPGTLVSLAAALPLPAGEYRQVHLVLADSTVPLTAAAQAAGLSYNAQIEITAASGVVSVAPLELPVAGAGLTIPTDLTLTGTLELGQTEASSGSTTATTPAAPVAAATTATAALAVTLDGARDVLAYGYGANTGYILSATTGVAEESLSGAISGTIDTSALSAGHPAVTVSAEAIDATQTHHYLVARRLVGTSGAFTLYPLPAPLRGTTAYDLVVACAGAETLIIRGVPVSAGSITAPTVVQSTPLLLTAAASVAADLSRLPPVLPAGARVDFYQTIASSGELPYLVDGSGIDPLTRRLPGGAFALAAGALRVGSYTTGGAIGIATEIPLEGFGGYVVGSSGLYRDDTLATISTTLSGSPSLPTLIAAPLPSVAAGAVPGTLMVTLSAPAGRYDSGFIVVSAGNRLVEAASAAALLATGGGTLSIGNLPGGSALAPSAGVPYQVAVRAWNSADPGGTLTQAAAASVPLGDSGAASIGLQLP